MDFHLISIKNSRKKPKTGDVFVVQPVEGIYYYGKVIDERNENKFEYITGLPLIYLYNQTTTKLEMPNTLSDILVAPILANYSSWTKGYFYNIGNIPVTAEEKNLNCGFINYPYDDVNKNHPYFRDVHGTRIDYRPQFYTEFGLCSYGGVNYEICKALGFE